MAMRTSGASRESGLTLAMVIIAFGVVTLLAGGPDNLMKACEATLRGLSDSAYRAWQSFAG